MQAVAQACAITLNKTQNGPRGTAVPQRVTGAPATFFSQTSMRGWIDGTPASHLGAACANAAAAAAHVPLPRE